MADHELRKVVLKKFYDKRHSADNIRMPVSNTAFNSERIIIFGICTELAENRLIEWNPVGAAYGDGKITARGIDVIEEIVRLPLVSSVDIT